MKNVHNNILSTVGDTPLVKLQRLSKGTGAKVYAKLESFNPGHSAKDRIALFMIEQAEKDGKIKPGDTIIEATSGNTGYSIAMICAMKGYKCILTVKDKSSKDKLSLMKAMGAEVVLCPSNVSADNPKSYYSVADFLNKTVENSFYLNQNQNTDNTLAHYLGTGKEIWEQTEGKITHLIASSSTGGTVSGSARYLKEKNPDVKVIAVDCEGSVLKKFHETGELDTKLKRKTVLEGVGKDIIPGTIDMNVIDQFIKIDDKSSIKRALHLAKSEGIMAGSSSGATIQAFMEIMDTITPNDVVVLVFSDHGSKYLSKIYDFEWRKNFGMEDADEDMLEKVANEFYLNPKK